MTTLTLSAEEKHFIITGIEQDFRCDGRSCEDYRLINVETSVMTNTNGSAQVKLVCLPLIGVQKKEEKSL